MIHHLPGTFDTGLCSKITRRLFLYGLILTSTGCVEARRATADLDAALVPMSTTAALYGALTNEPYPIEAINDRSIDSDLFRREVSYVSSYRPGTIVVNIPQRRLYLVQPGGKAMRYSVGVGRTEALNFSGTAIIGRKAEWPSWTPTASMIENIPRYAEYAGGMPGGLDNPLGARALYLYRNGVDTHFRLHGTIEPETIGTAVSSGCIRLFNHDIIDLYNRVPVGTLVIAQQS